MSSLPVLATTPCQDRAKALGLDTCMDSSEVAALWKSTSSFIARKVLVTGSLNVPSSTKDATFSCQGCKFDQLPAFSANPSWSMYLDLSDSTLTDGNEALLSLPASFVMERVLRGKKTTSVTGVRILGVLSLIADDSVTEPLKGQLTLLNVSAPDGIQISGVTLLHRLWVQNSRIGSFSIFNATLQDGLDLFDNTFEGQLSLSRIESGGGFSLYRNQYQNGANVGHISADYFTLSGTVAAAKMPVSTTIDSSVVPEKRSYTDLSISGLRADSVQVNVECTRRVEIGDVQANSINLSGKYRQSITLNDITVHSFSVSDAIFDGQFNIYQSGIRVLSFADNNKFGSPEASFFAGTGYDWIYFNWNKFGGNYSRYTDGLARLEDAYRKEGDTWSAEQVHHLRKEEGYKGVAAVARWWDYIFFDLPSGFGAKPRRTVVFGAVVILIFGLVYSRPAALIHKNNSTEFDSLSSIKRFRTAVQFSLCCFLRVPYTEWEPSEKSLSVRISPAWKRLPAVYLPLPSARALAYSEATLSWFLLAIFAASYVRVMQ